jgi:hypothetical protein
MYKIIKQQKNRKNSKIYRLPNELIIFISSFFNIYEWTSFNRTCKHTNINIKKWLNVATINPNQVKICGFFTGPTSSVHLYLQHNKPFKIIINGTCDTLNYKPQILHLFNCCIWTQYCHNVRELYVSGISHINMKYFPKIPLNRVMYGSDFCGEVFDDQYKKIQMNLDDNSDDNSWE